MAAEHISVADGKYTVVIDGGKLTALRHGEPWRDMCGDNLVYWLAVELRNARNERAELLKEVRRSLEHEHNPFEPNNQSARYLRLQELLARPEFKEHTT